LQTSETVESHRKIFLANDYNSVMITAEVQTAAVSAVAEVDRPQPGGAGCGRFFPCFVIYPDAALSVERNPQLVGQFLK
jgi:hypothetical protein